MLQPAWNKHFTHIQVKYKLIKLHVQSAETLYSTVFHAEMAEVPASKGFTGNVHKKIYG